MRARLARYAIWQARDYVLERGLPTAIVYVLLLFPVIVVMRRVDMPDAADLAAQQFGDALPFLGFLGALLAVNKTISADRHSQYFRFLFAKPVSVARFYAQLFVVHGIGMTILVALTIAALRWFVGIPVPWRTLAYAPLAYVTIGGIGFALSAVTRFDWVILAAIWTLAQLLRALYPRDHGAMAVVLDTVLPPAHKLGAIATALTVGAPMPTNAIVWALGYGLIAFVIGVLIVKRRPLAT